MRRSQSETGPGGPVPVPVPQARARALRGEVRVRSHNNLHDVPVPVPVPLSEPDTSRTGNINSSSNRNISDDHGMPMMPSTSESQDAVIMRNIASFLTFSDAASFASESSVHSQSYSQSYTTTHSQSQSQRNGDDSEDGVEVTPAGSWAVGVELDGGTYASQSQSGFWSASVATPMTPALVAVSPGATPHHNDHNDHNDDDDLHQSQDWVHQQQQQQQQQQYHQQYHQHQHQQQQQQQYHHHHHQQQQDDMNTNIEDEQDVEYMQNLLQKRRREWAQEKLAAAVFSHPRSLRSFCWEAYMAAKDIRVREQQRQLAAATAAAATAAGDESDPETLREPHSCGSAGAGAGAGGTRKRRRNSGKHVVNGMIMPAKLLHELIDLIFHNAPLSILLDVVEAVTETSLDTTLASFHITLRSMNAILQALGRLVRSVWDGVVNFNPFSLLEAIISLQFNAMGKTSGVLVSGIQSVATGVGSASSLALHRLSAVNPSAHRQPSSSSLLLPGNDGMRSRSRRGGNNNNNCNSNNSNNNSNNNNNNSSSSSHVLNKKLLKKLSTINAAARVVAYTEIQDDTGGLNQYARSRVQRMLHYDVSLRPFVATVSVKDASIDNLIRGGNSSNSNSNSDSNSNNSNSNNKHTTPATTAATAAIPPNSAVAKARQSQEDTTYADAVSTAEDDDDADDDDDHKIHANLPTIVATVSPAIIRPNSPAWDVSSSSSGSPIGSSFMCTPQSFPPTPHSRSMVIARGNRFSDDVIFLARDQLRVHGGLESENERTREMARLLREGKSLAVFDAKDAPASGIELTCGQHIAAKVGNMMYCGTRSMVPVLRNCWVYFEMLVIPRPVANLVVPASVATLSIGLSTGEMPPNTLVGAWQGSVGLCSTGQILMAGQWCTPVDSSMSAYTDSATVGCLVCLDDDSAFETWDGVMVTAGVIFSVNGVVVSPPLSTLSVTGRPGTLPSASSVQRGLMDARLGDESMESNNSSGPGPPSATLPLLVPAAEDLYPTVTLHSPASAVMCRFSAEDVAALSRDSIGAPLGVTVYAVDGSVIKFEGPPDLPVLDAM